MMHSQCLHWYNSLTLMFFKISEGIFVLLGTNLKFSQGDLNDTWRYCYDFLYNFVNTTR